MKKSIRIARQREKRLSERGAYAKTLWKIIIAVCLYILCCVDAISASSKNIQRTETRRMGIHDTIVLQLAWYHQFQFAGYYAAKDKGFYREAGLEVSLLEGGNGKNVIDEVLNDAAHYGVTNSELLVHRLHNKPIVVLAAIFQHSPIALIISGNSGVTSLQDLKGKRVKMSTTSVDIELQAIFQHEGISIDQLQLSDGFSTYEDYFDANLDAVAAYVTNQPYYLKQKNIPFSLIQPATYGIDFYGDCLFTSEKELRNHPERVKAFREASLKGWAYAMNHPDETIEIILKNYPTQKTREHLRYEAEEVRKLILPALVELGHMNPERWRHIAKTFSEFGMVNAEYSLEGFLYDPNPAPNYTWLRWAVGITSIIILFSFAIVATLLTFNRRLKQEVAERKLVEIELTKASAKAEKANLAKSIFLANMSHELRTPLNAILGFSSMLGNDAATTSAQKEKLSIINNSGEHLLSMIGDILDLSKVEAGRIELEESPCDLFVLFEDIGAMIKPRAVEKGLSFTLETKMAGSPYLSLDVGKLRQILINLLGNAVKFTLEGGVTLRVATEPLPETPVRCQVVVEVEDTGSGIDPARQERTFEPFIQEQGVSTKVGTGLGLAICKTFTELMGGSIEMESELGKGTLFRVRIPASLVEAADVKATESKPRVIGLANGQKTWRILIADDNQENRLLLKTLHKKAGFSTLEAQNGKEALEVFEKDALDFIWMDMRMPVMDGYEAVRQIRRRPGGDKLPIVAITASAFKSQRTEILATGCDDIVFKPFRAHEIFEVMARFLDIEYVYEQPIDAKPPIDATELTAAMLGELSPELFHDLDKTTLVANREAILEVIERIQKHAPETAEHLRALVQNFEIERIRELLSELE